MTWLSAVTMSRSSTRAIAVSTAAAGKSSIRIAWLPSLLEHRCVPLFLRRDEFVLRSADLRLKQFGADGQAEVASERV